MDFLLNFYQVSHTFKTHKSLDFCIRHFKMRINCLIAFKTVIGRLIELFSKRDPPTLLSTGIWNNNLFVAYLNFVLTELPLLETCILSLSQWLIRSSLTISYLQWLSSRNPFSCPDYLSWVVYSTNYAEDMKTPTIWLRGILSSTWVNENCIKNFK